MFHSASLIHRGDVVKTYKLYFYIDQNHFDVKHYNVDITKNAMGGEMAEITEAVIKVCITQNFAVCISLAKAASWMIDHYGYRLCAVIDHTDKYCAGKIPNWTYYKLIRQKALKKLDYI